MNNGSQNTMTHSPKCLTEQTPEVLELVDKKLENSNIVSLFFEIPDSPLPSFSPTAYQPGQFIMMWLPQVDEKPFVVSYFSEERFGVTVLRRGSFTNQLCDLEIGAKVGFRGPYGRGFWGWEKYGAKTKIVLVGGGCGMAALSVLADRLNAATVLQGAPSAEKLLFTDRFENHIIFTEDGSGPGGKGLPTECLEGMIEKKQVNMAFTCGPEMMMKCVVDFCHEANIPCQAALERYMKCGIGVCGQCECDGKLICRDGPVFSGEELHELPDFGKYHRTATGKRIEIENKNFCEPPRS